MTTLNPKRSIILLTILAILVLSFMTYPASATADAAEDASALTNAQNALAAAYDATATAERAGANIGNLLTKLHGAGDDLSQAEAAYRQGDFNSTVILAGACAQVAEGVITEANQLRLEAIESRITDTWIKTVVSIVGVVGIGLGSFGAWRLFKKRYHQRALKPKPEAVSNES